MPLVICDDNLGSVRPYFNPTYVIEALSVGAKHLCGTVRLLVRLLGYALHFPYVRVDNLVTVRSGGLK